MTAEPIWRESPQAPKHGLADVPETTGYKLKRALLGPPLNNDDLHSERLGKPTALAVLSSDVMSSAAYATESILRILVPAAGLAAFALITPVTLMLLLVLGLVCVCYRQVVKAYPVSGGSYVVSRENFGFAVAQIPGAALLLSYTLTVAVSIAAGVDAVISAFPALSPYPVELAIGFVLLLTYGNLRGIREAGRIFALPTYWFLANMGFLLVVGLARLVADGHLHRFPLVAPGHIAVGVEGTGLLLGLPIFLFLRGFANGGSAMTGMEAISNAVPVFREPAVRNARRTLVMMASILGLMFLGVSAFAALTHAVPFVSGTPTILSEIGQAVFGPGPLGRLAFYSLQFSTALILVLGANTSYNGFPLLMNFIAEDSYLPRTLRTRGHRLVYSNGICALTVASIALLVVTRAEVASLIPLYACTVFTGFTMAGAGMTKYHLTHPHAHRRRDLTMAMAACVASFVVTTIFVVTEFSRGAWLVVLCIPLIVWLLTRTNRRYTEERQVLAEDADTTAADSPVLRDHVVVVLVDSLDLATARAIQLARSLDPSGEARAVHFVTDRARAEKMARHWIGVNRWRIPLELVECQDRRIVRAVTKMAADLASDGRTEVTLVLPRRIYAGVFNRLLHANTADRIVTAVAGLPHVSATIAAFDVGKLLRSRQRAAAARDTNERRKEMDKHAVRQPGSSTKMARMEGVTSIGELVYRSRGRIHGRVRSMRVQPWSGVHSLECTVVDESGAINVVFLGRRQVAGISVGATVVAEGMVGKHDGQLAMINPGYEIILPSWEEKPAVS
ncbi:MAG: amino acid permease [Acidimicrobiales bacterium]